jgi:sugar phosphate isomerase/epimerase
MENRNQSMTRRTVLAAAVAIPLAAQPRIATPRRFTFCFFSKHLPELNYADLAKWLRDAGFDGADLTVRAGGHVLPERVVEDLPRAVEAIRSLGLDVPMITTELTSAADPSARPILKTAGRLKIPFFKLGYWRYGTDPLADVAKAAVELKGLVELAREYGVTAGFHNHPRNVGLAGWDGRQIVDGLDPRSIGYYYDSNNATEEGAVMGWEVTLRLALPRLKMAAFKDFYWSKVNGKWSPVSCPLGQGMVDWAKMFPLIKSSGFSGPVSIHQEYKPADRMLAARSDLEFVRQRLLPA